MPIPGGPQPGTQNLTDEQRSNAALIIQIGRERGLTDEEILGVLSASWMESRLRSLDYGDRDSLGLFQQRPSQGWGTREQILDPTYAINKFIDTFQNADGDTIGERVANTQRPARQYRHLYGDLIDNGTAAELFRAASGAVPTVGNQYPAPTPTGSSTVQPAPGGGYNVPGTGQLSGLPPDASPEEVRAYIIRNYGYAAVYLDHPELGPILQQAAREGWDAARLQGAVFNTQWWQNTSATRREWENLQATDPASARQQQQNLERQITTLWINLGGQDDTSGKIAELALEALRNGWDQQTLRQAVVASIDFRPGEGGGEQSVTVDELQQVAQTYNYSLSRDELESWTRSILGGWATQQAFRSYVAERAEAGDGGWMSEVIQQGYTPDDAANRLEAIRTLATQTGKLDLASNDNALKMLAARSLLDGWDEARLNREIAGLGEFRPGEGGGQQAVTVDQLQQIARQYAMDDIINRNLLEDWTRRILAGTDTAESFKSFVAERAESRYPYMAAHIERGGTPRDYFATTQNQVAQILEVNPDEIDLFNDPRFQQIVDFHDPKTGDRRGMTLSEAARFVRASPDARYTDQARDKGAASVEMLAKMFGQVA